MISIEAIVIMKDLWVPAGIVVLPARSVDVCGTYEMGLDCE